MSQRTCSPEWKHSVSRAAEKSFPIVILSLAKDLHLLVLNDVLQILRLLSG